MHIGMATVVGALSLWLDAGIAWADEEGQKKAKTGEPTAQDKAEAGKEGDKDKEAKDWVSLVPEKGMGDWKHIAFGGEGDTTWKDGVLTIGEGAELSGLVWGGALPKAPYEIELEARRTSGVDFFCGLTLPVRSDKNCVTFVVGGWGGGVVGVSSIDGLDASENTTTKFMAFKDDQWYKIRLQVRKNHLAAWIGDEQTADEDTTGKELGLRFGDIDRCVPLGLATFQTKAEVRGFRWRPLK